MKLLKAGLFCFLAMFLFYQLTYAQDWKTLRSAKVAWDAVTQDIDGNALPATDTIKYEVILSNQLDKEQTSILWTGPETTTTITLTAEGKFYLGVRAVRFRADEKIGQSEISWSDDPEATGGTPFGLVYFIIPNKPTGVKLE